jgi:trans-aconitate methyltransferase
MAFPAPSTSSQHWNAAAYADNAHFVPALGQPLVDLLQPQSGERILDLGCGDGALTEKLVALGAQVLGIDNSPDMIAAALRRGLDARVPKAAPTIAKTDAYTYETFGVCPLSLRLFRHVHCRGGRSG